MRTLGVILGAIFIAVASVVLALGIIAAAIILPVAVGYLCGWIIAYVFPATTASVIAWSGIPLTLPQIGATIGFLKAMLRGTLKVNTTEKSSKSLTDAIKKAFPKKDD